MADESIDDDAEFVAELTRLQGSLEVYVGGLLPGDPGREEVVQQTNAKIWQKRGEFTTGTHFRAWAFAIARYEVLNYRKHQARHARLMLSDELEQTIAEEMPQLDDDLAERRTALKDCLDELKSESRDLLMSRYGSKESIAETAERVGRSVGGLRVTLSRLRSALSDCIDRRIESEGQ